MFSLLRSVIRKRYNFISNNCRFEKIKMILQTVYLSLYLINFEGFDCTRNVRKTIDAN